MKKVRLCSLLITVAMIISACAGPNMTKRNGMAAKPAGIESLQADLDKTGTGAPTNEQYQTARAGFLSSMRDLKGMHEKQGKSIRGRIFGIVAGVGAVVGLGGIIASFVVDDEADQATIAQVSGLTAGVGAVFGLLNTVLPEQKLENAAGINAFLTQQLPLFEKRWPKNPTEVLTPDDWKGFVSDAQGIQNVINALGQKN